MWISSVWKKKRNHRETISISWQTWRNSSLTINSWLEKVHRDEYVHLPGSICVTYMKLIHPNNRRVIRGKKRKTLRDVFLYSKRRSPCAFDDDFYRLILPAVFFYNISYNIFNTPYLVYIFMKGRKGSKKRPVLYKTHLCAHELNPQSLPASFSFSFAWSHTHIYTYTYTYIYILFRTGRA